MRCLRGAQGAIIIAAAAAEAVAGAIKGNAGHQPEARCGRCRRAPNGRAGRRFQNAEWSADKPSRVAGWRDVPDNLARADSRQNQRFGLRQRGVAQCAGGNFVGQRHIGDDRPRGVPQVAGQNAGDDAVTLRGARGRRQGAAQAQQLLSQLLFVRATGRVGRQF